MLFYMLQDRVKQALKQQELEESSGHRKKRKSSVLNVKQTEVEEKVEDNKDVNNQIKEDKDKDKDKDEKPKVKRKSLPPPMGFAELLKLAAVKQHEPVVIEVKPKVDNERPMTKRQKVEYMHEKERKEQREKKDLEVNKKTSVTNAPNKPDKIQSNRVSKASEKSVISNSMPNKSTKCATTISKQITDKSNDKHNIEKLNLNKSSSKNELLEERKKLEAERRQLEEMRRVIEEEKKKLAQSKKLEDVKSEPSNKLNVTKPKSISKQISKDIKPRQHPPSDSKLQSALTNIKPKQFPPPDVKPIKAKTVIKKASNKSKYNSKLCDTIKELC